MMDWIADLDRGLDRGMGSRNGIADGMDGREIFIIASGLINDGMMGRKQAKQNPGDLSEMEADRRLNGWPRMATERLLLRAV